MDHAETMSLTGESFGVPIPGLDSEQLRQVLYFGYFPNLLMSPHPDYVMTHRIEPLTASQSRIECEWLFPPRVEQAPRLRSLLRSGVLGYNQSGGLGRL